MSQGWGTGKIIAPLFLLTQQHTPAALPPEKIH